MRAFAGIDWAKDDHAVCVVDQHGHVVVAETFTHDERGLRALIACLREHRTERVTIERPDGLLADRLLDAGLVVMAIHPNQVKAARGRYANAGGKSDRFDAFVLAELARTDSHRFRALQGDSDQTKALRALTRAHQDAVWTRVALANQLRAELDRVWPGATRIFAAIDSPIALAFLTRYPSPTDARRLTHHTLAALLRRHRYSGHRSPDELLARLRSAPAGAAATAEHAARRTIVLGLIAALRAIVTQIRTLEADIDTNVRAHPDGPIFLSFFHTATLTAARLLAEIGDDRGRYQTNDALAAHAGTSPVARESGHRKTASFRWACNHRLRQAITTLADTTRHHHPWAHATYTAARARGHDHPRALRTLARNWIRVLWRCWQTHTPYDPTRHGALTRQLAAQG
jgi:Transposase/Transposase IS116/IS110/IS902 family